MSIPHCPYPACAYFSTQTFSIDYQKLFHSISTASGDIDTPRLLGCSVETVQNPVERLSHTAMAGHSKTLAQLPMDEHTHREHAGLEKEGLYDLMRASRGKRIFLAKLDYLSFAALSKVN